MVKKEDGCLWGIVEVLSSHRDRFDTRMDLPALGYKKIIIFL
jgi:hypothetical protein